MTGLTAAIVVGSLVIGAAALVAAAFVYRGAQKTKQIGLRLRGMEHRIRRVEQFEVDWQNRFYKLEQAVLQNTQEQEHISEEEESARAAGAAFYAGR